MTRARELLDVVFAAAGRVPTEEDELTISIVLLILDSHYLLREYPGTAEEYHKRVQAAYAEALKKVVGEN